MDGQEEARRLTAGRNVERAMREHEPPYNPASLARASGVNVQTVRALISGKREQRTDTLARIDRALGLRPGTIEAWAEGDEAFFAEAQPEPQGLRERREAKGLSRKDLAALIDVDPVTLAEWEGGDTVPRAAQERIDRKLADVPTDEIVAEVDRLTAELGRRARGLG